MKNNYFRFTICLFAAMILTWTISCSGRSGKTASAPSTEDQRRNKEAVSRLINMTVPAENSDYKTGGEISVFLEPADKKILPDSVIVAFNGQKLTTIKSAPWQCKINPALTVTTGRKSLKATPYKDGKPGNIISRFIILLSDIEPKIYKVKVVNAYPHDKEAFTQGLVYYGGNLYEGTGQTGQSNLREVETETGKVKRQLNIGSNLFGEGITLYKDRIYQITWQDKVGFVYDRSNFNLLNKVYYQTEGWGLTTVDNSIVMSDGSNILYFMEPEMFTVDRQIEVYDNEKKVDQLNELEYINGEIWANIWMSDRIARIDPLTGKILGYIDLEGIMKETDTNVNVLNGIAWDKDNKRIFVTGKNWPKLFEVKVIQ